MAVANHCWEEAKVTSCQQRAAHSTQKRPQKGPKKTQKIHLFLFCNHPQNRGILRKYTYPFFALTTKKEIFCSRPVEESEPNMCCKGHHRPGPVQSWCAGKKSTNTVSTVWSLSSILLLQNSTSDIQLLLFVCWHTYLEDFHSWGRCWSLNHILNWSSFQMPRFLHWKWI